MRPESLRRPPALRPGDRVAVLAASSPVPDDRLTIGLDALRFAGLEPVVYGSARAAGTFRRYLAGDDDLRAGDLVHALGDPDIKGVLFARGGSGAQRTLAAIDFAPLREVEPKVLAGFSDVTAVLEAVAVELGWASLHAPMVAMQEPGAHYSFAALLQTLTAPGRVRELHFADARTVVGGTGQGVTLGGNLCVLNDSIGTPTSRPAAGGVLMIEEIKEEGYRIDRMLTHLRRSGYLDGVAAVIGGLFTDCGPAEEIDAILAERLGDLGVPMITGANIGHGTAVQTFPVGVAAELDADAGVLRLLDPPLQPSEPRR